MRQEKQYYVYILTNKMNTVLYTAMTGDLEGRIRQHKSKAVAGFTSRYNVTKLVYYEEFNNPIDAITREKQIKNWKRAWKEELIQASNRGYRDLAAGWYAK